MEEHNNQVTEANSDREVVSPYEFAFHILPTVALEEVPGVFGDIKTLIDREGGRITQEEAPQNFDLAYTVVKHTEGKNYKFNHSYFGWLRFEIESAKLEHLKTEIAHEGRILRSMIIRLDRDEIEHPFKVFEVKAKRTVHKTDEEKEEPKEVSEAEIEKAVEDITQ
jgi:ribosomal protein S6